MMKFIIGAFVFVAVVVAFTAVVANVLVAVYIGSFIPIFVVVVIPASLSLNYRCCCFFHVDLTGKNICQTLRLFLELTSLETIWHYI